MPEIVAAQDVNASVARLRALSRATKRQAIVSFLLCLVGLGSAVGSAVFNRKMAGNVRTLVQANESLRQTNDELAEANVRLQSALFEMQDANAVLMQKMGELQTADGQLQHAGAELLKWDQELKLRLGSCLQ